MCGLGGVQTGHSTAVCGQAETGCSSGSQVINPGWTTTGAQRDMSTANIYWENASKECVITVVVETIHI